VIPEGFTFLGWRTTDGVMFQVREDAARYSRDRHMRRSLAGSPTIRPVYMGPAEVVDEEGQGRG
jgi:hypothetical protein